MNADPLAQLLADAWMDANCLPEVRDVMRPLIERESTLWAAFLRAHRDEMLAALGGDKLTDHARMRAQPNTWVNPTSGHAILHWQLDVAPGESVWVFGEDA